jgi:hypothetical protein
MNTHAIIFHDGSKKLISQQAYDAIWSLSGDGKEKLRLGDSLISFSSIAKILPLSEFYDQYPKERQPQRNVFQFNGGIEEPTLLEGKKFNPLEYGDKCLKEMIKGLKKYIASDKYKGSEETLELLHSWEKKLVN